MTDRAWAASLPDETPVAHLPLGSSLCYALERAGIETLGQLRALPDRELLRLRQVHRRRLAQVRRLVPSPARG